MDFINHIAISIFLCLFLNVSCIAQSGSINTQKTKLRKCDDIKCQVVSELNQGDICQIIGSGKIETLDSYGQNAWLKIKRGNDIGFVYGALVDIKSNPSQETPFKGSGYIRDEHVNVRACPDLKGCDILFQIDKGQFCKIISKTKIKTSLKTLGDHPWYFVDIDGKKGYIFGGLITIESDEITITTPKVKVYSYPDTIQGQIEDFVVKGDVFKIKAQSPKSQLVRPHGRHYWYKLIDKGHTLGWVYGAYTSKAKEAKVDCQCVDYVKKILSISGPTKNAFEWDQVLQGVIPLTIDNKEVFLDYDRINNIEEVKEGDIAIFDKLHPEADDNYGHIGIVKKIIPSHGNTMDKVLTEGANHNTPLVNFYDKKGCNNVSLKNYLLDANTSFFRPSSK